METSGEARRDGMGFEPSGAGNQSALRVLEFGRRDRDGRRTSVSNKIGQKVILREAFCVVHHARTPTNVAEDEDRNRAQGRARAWT